MSDNSIPTPISEIHSSLVSVLSGIKSQISTLRSELKIPKFSDKNDYDYVLQWCDLYTDHYPITHEIHMLYSLIDAYDDVKRTLAKFPFQGA